MTELPPWLWIVIVPLLGAAWFLFWGIVSDLVSPCDDERRDRER